MKCFTIVLKETQRNHDRYTEVYRDQTATELLWISYYAEIRLGDLNKNDNYI